MSVDFIMSLGLADHHGEAICSECGCVIEGSVFTLDDDSEEEPKHYCQSCVDKLYPKCADCGERFPREDMEEDDDDVCVCSDCYADDWTRCNHCGCLVRYDDATQACDTEEYFCDDCRSRYLYRCDDCGDYYENEDNGRADDDIWVCDSCYNDNWCRCERCGCLVHSDNAYEYNGDYYCESCYDDVRDDDDDGNIHDYGYKPTPKFKRAESDAGVEHPLYFGAELEFSHDDYEERDSNLSAFHAEFGWDEDDFYLKHDSSLDDGFEIVSHPRTLASWHEMRPDIERYFSHAEDYALPDRDGLHVHISRNGMSPSHMVRFGSFFASEQDSITVIARRNSDRWAKYHKKPVTGDDCMRCSRNDERYSAVNWQNRSTVEVRVFQSTTVPDEFYAAIEFCHAAYQFTKSSVTLQQILKGEAWRLFLSFLKDNEDRYPALIRFWNDNCPDNMEVK